MNRNKEKTQGIVFTALAVFLTATSFAGPTYSGKTQQDLSYFGSDSPGNSDRYSRDGSWNFPNDGSFDDRSYYGSKGDDWDDTDSRFRDPSDSFGDHCDGRDGQTPAVPAPGSILLASVGLGVVGLIRKRNAA